MALCLGADRSPVPCSAEPLGLGAPRLLRVLSGYCQSYCGFPTEFSCYRYICSFFPQKALNSIFLSISNIAFKYNLMFINIKFEQVFLLLHCRRKYLNFY